MASRPGRRVAIVAGLRTPFVKAGTSFKDLSALELGRQVVSELVQRAEIPVRAIDQLVFGTVIPSVQLPNIAREVGLAAGLPKNLDAYSVVRACATSLQAMTSAADAIALGEIYPVTIERLAQWIPSLERKGIVLAPISATADMQPDRTAKK